MMKGIILAILVTVPMIAMAQAPTQRGKTAIYLAAIKADAFMGLAATEEHECGVRSARWNATIQASDYYSAKDVARNLWGGEAGGKLTPLAQYNFNQAIQVFIRANRKVDRPTVAQCDEIDSDNGLLQMLDKYARFAGWTGN